MIASLKGVLTSIGKSDIIIEVNGVGYFLNVSSKLIPSLGKIGSKLSLLTDLVIKDDKIVMYGFVTSNEQRLFKLLQTVQGVGPKAALSILSALTVEEIILGILSGDKAMISRSEGIGPKVAGRIITELLEKAKNFDKYKTNYRSNTLFVNKNQVNMNLDEDSEIVNSSQIIEDVISALVNLGYSRSEVFSVVMKVKKEFSLKNKNKEFTVSKIVPIALRDLSKGLK